MKRRMKNAPEANLWILSENNKWKTKMTSTLQWCIKEGAWVMHWYSSHLLKDRWISHLLSALAQCLWDGHAECGIHTQVFEDCYVREAFWLGISVLFAPTSAHNLSICSRDYFVLFCTKPQKKWAQQCWKLSAGKLRYNVITSSIWEKWKRDLQFMKRL